MKKIICDRCGNEMEVPMTIWVGSRATNGLDLCVYCTDAFNRFMGINTPGGGYEKLDSEVAEQ